MNKKTRDKLLNIVRQNYEDIADDFSDSRNYIWPELRVVIAIRQLAEKQPRKNCNVLDLGCGNGRLAELFAGQNSNYTGVEQSVKLSNLARQKLADLKITGNIITGDVLNLNSITDKKFDLVLCIAVLPHIPSAELRRYLLRQIKNHLASDGIFIITAWNLRAQWKYKKLIWKHGAQKILGLNKMDFGDIVFPGFQQKSPRYYHAFTENKLKKILIQAGYKINKLYSDKKNIYAICKI
ncbi:hypothetical protein COT99_03540 [Candidatus Falkowbacteria bacterium CG10_big_fil_rev_8_21_14_0_10_43_10]|uniref:Methyltransferase domain-containing protein n=1 Tax=Candidatus Falkowbacteria bacterium CG10_big_fil_rev_8_21_14_0_10_43_10 TaxID=1974567 RepID=A0A2H0V1L8_9BACT|nr:MAG: hypothetical protein COT99_03540 [Candidatus Falkowbacteria bacterium CG10_big_fil_rev_8_21_14_0_10_43_10]